MNTDPEKLTIVHHPHPVLRKVAQPVESVTPEVQAICTRMLELMHEAPGVGLAAPQVGLELRLFVANATGDPQDDMVFINPLITVEGKATEDMEEGCLSLPGINASIRRPKAVTIEATDIKGNRFKATSDDLPARIWQHENDHLDGVMIIDKMSPIDKMANRKALKEMEG
ncbi:MAG TPA: peptide deformylase [Phycisphaerales bacterium]|nr:peptide deformylase [Phycisphaerales bacterium]HCD30828.1 peptide deformylase [Phycisphaerales bacterium]|tara:strand:+ start:2378 stop:2887 length:510 start_codon:yes stop_codon:yes gene_type:complete